MKQGRGTKGRKKWASRLMGESRENKKGDNKDKLKRRKVKKEYETELSRIDRKELREGR